MRKFLTVLILPILALSPEYEMECTQIFFKPDERTMVMGRRCENKEAVCYHRGLGGELSCFPKLSNWKFRTKTKIEDLKVTMDASDRGEK